MAQVAPGGAFPHFYSRAIQKLGIDYEGLEFLYPSDGPWPQLSFDQSFGMSPEVQNIPQSEQDDWQKHIGKYYTDNALGSQVDGKTTVSPFGERAAQYAMENVEKNGIAGYAALTDAQFVGLLCEGLYSKFLCELDPQDFALFDAIQFDPAFQYFKSDYSCMKVVQKCWDGEHVAPTIVIVRRPKNNPLKKYVDQGAYELVAIAIAKQDAQGEFQFTKDLVFTPDADATHQSWRLAMYFVLQGAFHRINLVDHVKVHLPSDTINAVTKTILPRWHVMQQLLLPHFWLTLPVNNAVLEGQRSLINRDTWYPWSPFVARGEEVRKLLPFFWAGSDYYWDEANTSYPSYSFSLDPKTIPAPNNPKNSVNTFIGLDVSRYSAFLADYYPPVLTFAKSIVAQLPQDQTSLTWLEIQRWAYHISSFIPGFPDQTAILDRDTLTRVLAMIVWNASVGHSSDHSVLHTLFEQHQPMSTIMRVKPPTQDEADVTESLFDALPEQGQNLIETVINKVIEAVLRKNPTINKLLEEHPILKMFLDGIDKKAIGEVLKQVTLSDQLIPLCWPSDLIWSRMADLLFYLPHNSSLLYETQYLFEPDGGDPQWQQLENAWRQLGRPLLTAQQKQTLHDAKTVMLAGLDAVNTRYHGAVASPLTAVAQSYGFPKLKPGPDDQDIAKVKREQCIAAGIQY